MARHGYLVEMATSLDGHFVGSPVYPRQIISISKVLDVVVELPGGAKEKGDEDNRAKRNLRPGDEAQVDVAMIFLDLLPVADKLDVL